MYRGGNWNNGTNAGVFYLNGNNDRSNTNANIGFRSAPALFVRPEGQGLAGTSESKGCTRPAARLKRNARRLPDNRDDAQTTQTGQKDLQRDLGKVAAGGQLQRRRIVTRGATNLRKRRSGKCLKQ